MIITVTLNPAIDKTIYIENFTKGEVNKVAYSVKDPGGKGINVSKVAKNLGCNTVALGFIGGEEGEYIRKSLNDIGIHDRFIKTTQNTRTNIKIVDVDSGNTTDINDKGGKINEDELKAFLNLYKDVINKNDIVVLSGSVLEGIDKHIYKILAQLGKQAGCRVILDVSGPLLKEGIKAQPYMIKPNIAELEEVLEKKLDTLKKVIAACKDMISNGVEYVCVSIGSKGAILVGKDLVLQGKVPKVHVKSTVGAGDSLVAGIAAGIDKNYKIEEAFKLGICASIAAVTKEGTKAPTYKEVQEYMKDIEITDMNA